MLIGQGLGQARSGNRPCLNLNFLAMSGLDPRVSFTRAASASYFDGAGILQTAGSDVPRFDHDPLSLAPLGLLIEPQRTNTAIYSAQFDRSDWTKDRTTVTADATTAPDGTMSADLIRETTATGERTVYKPQTTDLITSFFVKPAGRTWVQIDRAPTSWCNFNIQTGAIGYKSSGASAPFVIACPNGWYRIGYVSDGSNGWCDLNIITGNINSRGPQYIGDGASGVYLWGADQQTGTFPTSHIPTTGAAATRATDVATVTLGSWFNQSAGTLVAEDEESGAGRVSHRAVVLNDGSAAQEIIVGGRDGSGALIIGSTTVGGATKANLTAVTAASLFKVAFAFQDRDFAGCCNGQAIVASTALGSLPTGLTQITLGNDGANAHALGGWMRRLRYWPRRLPNDVLRSLTA